MAPTATQDPVPVPVPSSKASQSGYVHPTDILPSGWPTATDLSGGAQPRRFEGTIFDVMVRGSIPKELYGTFYRIMPDYAQPPTYYKGGELNAPIDGDGTVAAFRFKDGKVDYRQRFVETDRFKIERRARKSMYDSRLQPFNLPSKTMTAHPKQCSVTGNLVGFGYEAKGLATKDVYYFEVDPSGKTVHDLWLEAPWCAFIHDCALTPNYLVLMLWPFEANLERMKAGGHHWAYDYDKPITWITIPRGAKSKDEVKYWHWKNGMPIHTAAGFEDEQGRIIIDSSLVHGNAFPFFPPDSDEQKQKQQNDGTPKAQFVRWTIDPRKDNNERLPDPEVILDTPSEFPQIDNRFMGVEYSSAFINVFVPDRSDGNKNVFQGLNGLAHYKRKEGTTEWYYAGDNCLIQEPVFSPRSKDAPEGDGYVLAIVDRLDLNRSEVVVIDTRDFTKAVAAVQLPFAIRSGIHGQWIPGEVTPDFDTKGLVDLPKAENWAPLSQSPYDPNA
ncbi:related to lignostilbene alpha,beta-dioxygenase I [Ustilago trichophora]|uniref:Related to lignostilbene alpha,beta-dioxygenase I n=1 Tax=Ustilago trichophora TaxID=86804 RepID=A0A5C3E9F3_9BASI|nr:related to lignostilbene alpha,beta-dioxygenase I [Ustilago trichophora]